MALPSLSSTDSNPARTPAPVHYEYTLELPDLLARLECSLVLSTYQAGRLVRIGIHDGQPAIGFLTRSSHHCGPVMGRWLPA
jgi:hypothetical protein